MKHSAFAGKLKCTPLEGPSKIIVAEVKTAISNIATSFELNGNANDLDVEIIQADVLNYVTSFNFNFQNAGSAQETLKEASKVWANDIIEVFKTFPIQTSIVDETKEQEIYLAVTAYLNHVSDFVQSMKGLENIGGAEFSNEPANKPFIDALASMFNGLPQIMGDSSAFRTFFVDPMRIDIMTEVLLQAARISNRP